MCFVVEFSILVRQEVCGDVRDVAVGLQAKRMLTMVRQFAKKMTFVSATGADLTILEAGT